VQEVDYRIDGMIERLEPIRAEANAKLEETADQASPHVIR